MRRLAMQRWGSKAAFRLPALIVPFMLSLGLSPAMAAVDHDVILRDRLEIVRELLDRRQAHRSMLMGKIERFSGKLDALQADREISQEVLADQADRARAYERQLDKLMPRLLPRLNLLEQYRKKGARTIAGLASMERSTELEDRARSRLRASQSVSIEQMRLASTAVRLLRRVPNMLSDRHRDVDFQIPLLAAAVDRLDLRQSQLQRRRDAAIRDLADLTIDIERLTTEEHRLARNMLARRLEATDGADVPAGVVKTVLKNRRGIGKSTTEDADVRGVALRLAQPTPVARPLDGVGAESGFASIDPAIGRDATITAKSAPSAAVVGKAGSERRWSAEVASLTAPAGNDGLTAPIAPGPVDTGPALVPTIETIGYNAGRGDRPEIEIAARPRQRVAAHDAGRVAFAGDFRSYGLLLIIEHGNGYHTLLWGFSSLDVEFGDAVRAGQIVGTLKDGPSPKLLVELRRNGQPVSPEVWLAASNSGVKG